MRRSKFYNMRLPERGAREGEANDAADIEDLTYDLGIIDAEMERQRLEDVRLEKDKATKLEMSQHKSAAVLDHPDGSVTDAKLGQRTVLTTSGTLQTLLTAIGNAIKAISGADTWNGTPATTLKDAKTHMGDAVKHITAQEREIWNAAATDRHSHTNKSVLDSITAAMVTAWNTVSSKLPLAGGTLTGFLTLHAAPATDMHAATKKYVDDKMAASGSGDMTKAVYDPGGRELPYIPKQDVDALAWGGDFGASGTPVSIAYAGANRIASITAYGENAQGGTTEAPVALTGISSITVNDDVTELPIPRPLRRVGDVRDVCVTRQEYEGTEKLVVTYNVGFVELDGTEDVTFHDYGNGKRLFLDLSRSAFGQYSLEFSHGEVGDTPTIAGGLAASFNASALYRLQIIGIADTWTALGVTDTATAKTWLAAQKAAGTPVQIAYQLAAPEVYATDPLDFDNAAGPLTVMTDGEVEVTLTHRMLTPYTAWTIQYDSEGEYTGDFFNVEDYDRIKQNIEYLREYAYFLYGGFTLRGMVAVTVESYGYASTIDALDANLEAIAANTFRPPDMLPVKQWRGNQPPPGADDWNRIENTCLLLFEQFERQFACLPKLAFELKGSAF